MRQEPTPDPLEPHRRNLKVKMAVMESVGRLLTRAYKSEDVLIDLCRLVLETVGAEAVFVHSIDPETGTLERSVSVPEGTRSNQKALFDRGKGPVAWACENFLPLYVENFEKADPELFSSLEIEGIEPRNGACLPLRAGSETIGAVEIFNKTGKPVFDVEDLDNLWLLAEQTGLLIMGGRFASRERRFRNEIDSLTRIGAQLTSTLGVDQLLGLITLTANEMMRTEASSLFLVDEETDEVVFHTVLGEAAEKLHKTRMPRDKGVVGWVIERGKPALVEDTASDPRFAREVGESVNFESKSLLCVPLISKDRTLGAIEVINLPKRRPPDEEYVKFLSVFAGFASVALENARLYDNLQRANAELQEKSRIVAEMTQDIIRSEKMLSLGQLAASVAHDINNPLAAIMNFAELSLMADGLSGQVHKDLTSIRNEARRISDIVRQLLEFSRSKGPGMEAENLNDVVRDTLVFTEHYLKRFKDVKVRVELRENLPRTKLCKGQIQQVFVNLIMNAAQAMPDGGPLVIATGRTNAPLAENEDELWFVPTRLSEIASRQAFANALNGGDFVVISFTDAGVGMDEATLRSAFKPFFTTKAKGEGTGLGLSIVRDIVHKHKGHLRVRSTPGQGSTFEIYLPVG